MKIFLSHSSKNKLEGEALVRFLTSIGVAHDNIVYTSNPQYGVPNGYNIFDWLKEKINEKPFVIYLLSSDYYNSVACLNEMGAAWIVESDHVAIFTNNFDASNREFLEGVLDPRRIAFSIDDKNRLIGFGESIAKKFGINLPAMRLTMAADQLISDLKYEKNVTKTSPVEKNNAAILKDNDKNLIPSNTQLSNDIKSGELSHPSDSGSENSIRHHLRFVQDIFNGKTKDEEIMLAYYCMDTAKFKLGVGWKKDEELTKIKEWEDIIDVDGVLSSNYDSALRRFEVKKLTKVIEYTSSGNPRLIELVPDFKDFLSGIPAEIENAARIIVDRNPKPAPSDNQFPF